MHDLPNYMYMYIVHVHRPISHLFYTQLLIQKLIYDVRSLYKLYAIYTAPCKLHLYNFMNLNLTCNLDIKCLSACLLSRSVLNTVRLIAFISSISKASIFLKY